MEKIIFTCKTITPLVMNGAYGEYPELRPPGIKASLRFWWRALNGHLTLDQLREQEAKIFGSTKGRSKIQIRVVQDIGSETIKQSILPHKGGSIASAFPTNKNFKIRIDCDNSEKVMLKNLFILACTLGGWGKRSRRGFGSVTVTEIDGIAHYSPTDLQGLSSSINSVVPGKYSIQSNTIKPVSRISKLRGEDYPYILEIKLGNEAEAKTLAQIGQVTHDVKASNPQDYSKSLGDGRPRLASPVFVSILPNGNPVITTLKKESCVNTDLQNNLKSKILNP